MEEFDLKTAPEENESEYYGDGGEQQDERATGDYQDFTADDVVDDSHVNGGGGSGGSSLENKESNGGNVVAKTEQNEDAEDYAGHEEQPEYNDDGSMSMRPKGKDDDKRKLFVGGLSWDTKEKDLKEYFSKFGEVEGLTYKTDAMTGRPRGFAFIIFTELSSVEQVLATGDHVINGKKVDPKRAKARPGKIFVGGLTAEISNDDVKDYFTQFGNVIDMEVPIDKSTNQRKNYCFITFDDIAVSQELLKSPKQIIGGKEVDVKQAVPMAKPAQGGGWHDAPATGRGGRGRGGGMRGRGSWGGGYGAGGGYPPAYSAWGGGGYGGGGYGGYDYSGYYDGYEGYGGGYEAPYGPPRGRGRGGFGGKMRGARGGGVPRHLPY